jgi:type IV pilus assembly protein PilA
MSSPNDVHPLADVSYLKVVGNMELDEATRTDFRHMDVAIRVRQSLRVGYPTTKRETGKTSMRKQKGFSLIELLIVVAIILIIAAIAIPNLLRARIAANESSAVASVRTINTAQVAYNSAYPTVGFAVTLGVLTGNCTSTSPTSTTACLIDSQLASGTKSGYTFALSAGGSTSTPQGTYETDSDPITPNQTGVRYFCSVSDGVVRYGATDLTGTCSSSGTPLQ